MIKYKFSPSRISPCSYHSELPGTNSITHEPTETSKQPIRTRYLEGHVTGYHPIRDQYFLIRSVPGSTYTWIVSQSDKSINDHIKDCVFQSPGKIKLPMLHSLRFNARDRLSTASEYLNTS
eukprot:sb/3476042/